MSEFLLPPGGRQEATLQALEEGWRASAPGREVRRHPEAQGPLVVLDTFDGLVRAGDLACRWEDGRLVLLDGGGEGAGLVCPAPGGPLQLAELPSGRLRERLQAAVGRRALLPLAAVERRVQAVDLLDGEQKTVVRVQLEAPAGGRPARVRVLELRGYGGQAAEAAALLHGLGLAAAERSLAEEALEAAGHPPEGISAKVHVEIERGEAAQAAAARVLLALLEVIEANLPGTLQDIDSEFLHDLRVSVRRTRAVQRELKAAFPADEIARFREEFRWLQQVTGAARDLDVYVEDFEEMRVLVPESMGPDLDPLLAVLRERRATAREAMGRELTSARARRLLLDWRRFLERLRDHPATQPVVEAAAGERIAKVYRRMVKMGGAIGPDSPAGEYHELRKKGKELRYLLELFGAELFDAEVVSPMVKRLKALQDVLGRHQDREVQQATVRALGRDVGEPAALLAMGALLARLADEERAARAEFAERFAEFAGKRQRRAVRKALR